MAKSSLGNGFAGSAGGLEKIREVWEPSGVRRERDPPDGCPGLQPAGLGGSQCYPLTTNANYSIINEHAAIVGSVTGAGGDGDGGNERSAKYRWCGRGTRRDRAAHACTRPAARHFSFSPSLKINPGLAETLTLPHVVFPFVFPIPCPRAAHGAGPGLSPCRLATETPTLGSAPNPFPLAPLNIPLVS